MTRCSLRSLFAFVLALPLSACSNGAESPDRGGAVEPDGMSLDAAAGDRPAPRNDDVVAPPRDASALDAGQTKRDAARPAKDGTPDAGSDDPSTPSEADARVPPSDTKDGGSEMSGPGAGGDGCDRDCLIEFNSSYLEALVAKDASKLATSDDVRFTENGKELPLTEGLWKVASKLRTYRQDWTEPRIGQTAGFVVLDDTKGAVVHAFRLKVVKRKVAEIESIVARQGEATFFAPNDLRMADPVFDAIVPPEQRASREEMIAVAELYFQGLDSGDGSKIPVDARAERNENGTVTASGSRIQNVSMFSYIEEIKRRFVIVDEERGQVLAFVLFEIPRGIGGSSRTLHLAEAFKVQGGKIHGILAFMVNQPLGTPSGWEE